MPSAAVCGEIGRETSDALEEVLGSDTEIEPQVPPVERGEAWVRRARIRVGQNSWACGVAVFGFRQRKSWTFLRVC